MFAKTQAWMTSRGIFEDRPPVLDYASAVAA
jgi:hypothetical protein